MSDVVSWGLSVAQVYIETHPDTDFIIKEYIQYIHKSKGYKDSPPLGNAHSPRSLS